MTKNYDGRVKFHRPIQLFVLRPLFASLTLYFSAFSDIRVAKTCIVTCVEADIDLSVLPFGHDNSKIGISCREHHEDE